MPHRCKARFTPNVAAALRQLIAAKCRADRTGQKRIRDEMRSHGFYISAFGTFPGGMQPSHFDELVNEGMIKILAE